MERTIEFEFSIIWSLMILDVKFNKQSRCKTKVQLKTTSVYVTSSVFGFYKQV